MSTATMSPPKRRPLAAGLVPADAHPNRWGQTPTLTAAAEPEFPVLPPKLAALEQLGDCEDDISWDELIDCLKLRESIEASFRECNAGLGYTQEEAEAMLAKWLK